MIYDYPLFDRSIHIVTGLLFGSPCWRPVIASPVVGGEIPAQGHGPRLRALDVVIRAEWDGRDLRRIRGEINRYHKSGSKRLSQVTGLVA